MLSSDWGTIDLLNTWTFSCYSYLHKNHARSSQSKSRMDQGGTLLKAQGSTIEDVLLAVGGC